MATRRIAKKNLDMDEGEDAEAVQSSGSSRGRSLVFISHDSRDADLAEAFANLLSDVSGGTLKSFRSSDKKGSSGIEFGTEWYKAIMSQLGNATDVVALLTHNSIDRPWILYEAGVAKGKLDTNVLGVALGVPLEKVSSGPFGQFQNCGDDEDSLTKLVMQLLQRNPEAAPREEAVRRQVTAFIDGIKKISSANVKPAKAPATDETGIAKLFEEVKAMVRELPERVDERVRFDGRSSSSKRLRRLGPMMFEEILFHPAAIKETSQGPAIAWLMFITSIKDDLPWLYEVGLELYRALTSNNALNVANAKRNIFLTIDMATNNPLLRDVLHTDDSEIYFIIRHLPEMIERFLGKIEKHGRRPRGAGQISENIISKD